MNNETDVLRVGHAVLLRELRPTDLTPLVHIWSDPDVMRNVYEQAWTPQECADMLARARREAAERPRRVYRMGIVRRQDDTLVGTITVELERYSGAYVRAAAIAPSARRQRLGLEAFHLVSCLVFEDLGLHRLWCACLTDNLPAQKGVLRYGARREGTIREFVNLDGTWRDAEIFGLLDHEWRTRQDEDAGLLATPA
ncbi:GNAT family N-acetyltransferase [Marinactinospora thermotolerans]|uniref:Acetyltransferase (GNAT) domain-containing protein n=1 Tax=Marinactinospora thermotolerans DSM 45154 TaxID=1122192 RepID=A0A1T4PQ80_9ACTN|nr:GNAT family protein [Marinactinospora thermotolerans]SJZ93559.1 Acetyltransferase (GNAT) domain-containing protein [Marinactinospora thermotolerans DSM 45154]